MRWTACIWIPIRQNLGMYTIAQSHRLNSNQSNIVEEFQYDLNCMLFSTTLYLHNITWHAFEVSGWAFPIDQHVTIQPTNINTLSQYIHQLDIKQLVVTSPSFACVVFPLPVGPMIAFIPGRMIPLKRWLAKWQQQNNSWLHSNERKPDVLDNAFRRCAALFSYTHSVYVGNPMESEHRPCSWNAL